MKEKDFYKKMLENMYEGIYFVDKDRKITFWNKGAERITGYAASEVLNMHCYNNILNHVNEEGVELCLNGCPLHATLDDGIMREARVYLHHKEGYRLPVSIRTIAIEDNKNIIGAIEVFQDDSLRENLFNELEQLKELALKDQLTGLYNRRYIDSFLEEKKNQFLELGIPFGIAFMDLDKLKNFNDQYGHNVGDEVLKIVAKTFLSIMRENDLIGRWGGEEFIGIFLGVNNKTLQSISEKIRMLVENSSLLHNGTHLAVTISIGATLFTKEDTVEMALKRADELLYKSKVNGRNLVTIG